MNARSRPVHGGYPGEVSQAVHHDAPHAGGVEVTYIDYVHTLSCDGQDAARRHCVEHGACQTWPKCSCEVESAPAPKVPEKTCRTCTHIDTDVQKHPCLGCRDFQRWQLPEGASA